MLALRRYRDRSVPEEVLRRVLKADRLTPSGMNARPWHFVVVRDRETLAEVASRERYGQPIASVRRARGAHPLPLAGITPRQPGVASRLVAVRS